MVVHLQVRFPGSRACDLSGG